MARGMKGIIIIAARIGGKLRDKFLTNKLLIAKSCPSKVVVVGYRIYIYIGKATMSCKRKLLRKIATKLLKGKKDLVMELSILRV